MQTAAPAQANAAAVPGSARSPVIPDVVEEHLDELAFLAIQRRKLIFSGEQPLGRVVAHDARRTAHWEGLVTAGPAAVDIALKRLDESFDPWDVYAAALVWLQLGSPSTRELQARLVRAEGEVAGAWAEALRRTPRAVVEQLLPRGPADAPGGAARQAVTYACGWHGVLRADMAQALARSPRVEERRSLARALGWCAAAVPNHQQLLAELGTDADPQVRAAALWSVVLLSPLAGRAGALQKLERGQPDPFDVRVLGLVGVPADGPRLEPLAASPDPVMAAAALRALGDLGDPAAVPRLLPPDAEEDENLASARREALAMILGTAPGAAGDDPWKAAAPELRAEWTRAAQGYGSTPRRYRGVVLPWSGPADEEPMEATWRAVLVAPRAGLEWLRVEVPDGFFTAEPCPVAVAGE